MVLHPAIVDAGDFGYELWPHDRVSTWLADFSNTKIPQQRWRQVKMKIVVSTQPKAQVVKRVTEITPQKQKEKQEKERQAAQITQEAQRVQEAKKAQETKRSQKAKNQKEAEDLLEAKRLQKAKDKKAAGDILEAKRLQKAKNKKEAEDLQEAKRTRKAKNKQEAERLQEAKRQREAIRKQGAAKSKEVNKQQKESIKAEEKRKQKKKTEQKEQRKHMLQRQIQRQLDKLSANAGLNMSNVTEADHRPKVDESLNATQQSYTQEETTQQLGPTHALLSQWTDITSLKYHSIENATKDLERNEVEYTCSRVPALWFSLIVMLFVLSIGLYCVVIRTSRMIAGGGSSADLWYNLRRIGGQVSVLLTMLTQGLGVMVTRSNAWMTLI